MARIKQKTAVSALVALGMKNAGDWSVEKLQSKLSTLPADIEESDKKKALLEAAGDDVKDLVKLVADAIESGDKIEVAAGKGGAEKNGKAEGGDKPKGNRKPPEIKRDFIGCREGSMAATINSKLSKKPKPIEKIAEEAGCTPARVKDHLKFWIKKQAPIVEIEGKGFALKA